MFDWNDGNIEHIAKHNVTFAEVEEAMTDPRRLPIDAYNVRGETRQALMGATGAGRILVVHFLRQAKDMSPNVAGYFARSLPVMPTAHKKDPIEREADAKDEAENR